MQPVEWRRVRAWHDTRLADHAALGWWFIRGIISGRSNLLSFALFIVVVGGGGGGVVVVFVVVRAVDQALATLLQPLQSLHLFGRHGLHRSPHLLQLFIGL